jgi:hypothetical protein
MKHQPTKAEKNDLPTNFATRLAQGWHKAGTRLRALIQQQAQNSKPT